ncbi:piggyBac transposable element-derived protein 4-like [Argiope bruennichi]|uniref:piggyBac transposable element-derived protein 4-like n=1 Tax=Argiope bruennichi TaxID=94029 RepID=UPI0024954DCA|nr:piggyBac transposable element-derived protein 4-like [Argiope bruennichi]
MKSQHTNVEQLWASDGTGIQILRAAMSYKRFLFLLRCIRFDDIDTGAERRKSDKLAAIRSIWDSFVQNCLKSYNTSEFVTIDEMLHPFRGRCSWIQYIPNKPAKYGIKIFALCDSKTFYCSNMEIYIGKQPPGPFAVENKPLDIVKRLVMPIENSNKNLTTDNWYTSFPLVVYLLEKKITFIGTVKKNKKEIHAEFLPRKHRIVGTSIFGFQKNKTLVSYVPKKNKAVVLVSSLHDKAEIDGDSGKPEVILDYNMTKGGVDTCDKMCSAYSVSQITRRWPLVLFYIMMNIAGINSTEQC